MHLICSSLDWIDLISFEQRRRSEVSAFLRLFSSFINEVHGKKEKEKRKNQSQIGVFRHKIIQLKRNASGVFLEERVTKEKEVFVCLETLDVDLVLLY
jgi:hypothetical protein